MRMKKNGEETYLQACIVFVFSIWHITLEMRGRTARDRIGEESCIVGVPNNDATVSDTGVEKTGRIGLG